MVKVLTNNGLNNMPDGYEYQSMDVQRQGPEIKKMSKIQKKKEISEFNSDEEVKINGLYLIKKRTFYLMSFISVALILLAIISIFWFGNSFSRLADKSFSDQINIEGTTNIYNYTINTNNQIDPNINNNINITINIPEEILVKLTNQTT